VISLRVGLMIFFGGLEAEMCPSKNEIISEHLLGSMYVFGFLNWCFAYI
jgi:hypothetical protein